MITPFFNVNFLKVATAVIDVMIQLLILSIVYISMYWYKQVRTGAVEAGLELQVVVSYRWGWELNSGPPQSSKAAALNCPAFFPALPRLLFGGHGFM